MISAPIQCRNAGFDPALFRVDAYGNVLYLHADSASPLAWDIDHWFPCASKESLRSDEFFFVQPRTLLLTARSVDVDVCRGREDGAEQPADSAVAGVQEEAEQAGVSHAVVGSAARRLCQPVPVHLRLQELRLQVRLLLPPTSSRPVPSVRPLAAVRTLHHCTSSVFLTVQKQSIRVLVHPWCQRGAELAAGGGGARVPAALL